MTTYGDAFPATLLTQRTALQPTLTARALRAQVPANERRNMLLNNMLVGAAAPNAIPAGWVRNIAAAGISSTNSDIQIDTDGLPFFDVRFFGTPSATTSCLLYFVSGAQISAAVGQLLTTSCELALVAGSLANVNSLQMWQGEFSNTTFLTNGATIIGPSLTASLQRFSTVRTLASATVNNVQPAIVFTTTNGAALDFTLRIKLPQTERGSAVTAIQRVRSAADITEPGIIPVYHALFDGGDDVPASGIILPTIAGGEILIASPYGIWIEPFDFAGGNFSFGPTTYLGGPAGIVDTLFQRRISGVEIFGQPMTQEQWAERIAYWMGKGAAGLWVLSDELVTNGAFDTDASWVKGTSAVIADGYLEQPSGAGGFSYQQISPNPGAGIYLDSRNIVSGQFFCGAWANGPTNTVQWSNTLTAGLRRQVFTSATASLALAFTANGTNPNRIDNVSLKRLTLNTDPLA